MFTHIGIDEAGRGPLAGPVAVGLVAAKKRKVILPYFSKVRDSKKLSAQKRREIFNNLKDSAGKGEIFYCVSFVGPGIIDRVGIVKATHIALERCLKKTSLLNENTNILLDGGLRAPKKYAFQETIIKGDEKEPLIALASIVAKVLRDEKMERIDIKYPEYRLLQHKGYGTKLHFRRIKRHGAANVHRKSFL